MSLGLGVRWGRRTPGTLELVQKNCLSPFGNVTCLVTCAGVTQLNFAHNPTPSLHLKVKWPRLTMDGVAQGLSWGLWAKDWILPRWEKPLGYYPLRCLCLPRCKVGWILACPTVLIKTHLTLGWCCHLLSRISTFLVLIVD